MKKNILFLVALLMGLVINVNGASAASYFFINDSSHDVLSLIYETSAEYGSRKERQVNNGIPLKYQTENQELTPHEWDDNTNNWYSDHVTRNGFDYYAMWPLRSGEYRVSDVSYLDGDKDPTPRRVIALLDNNRVLETSYMPTPKYVVYYITDSGIERIPLPDDENAGETALKNIFRQATHRASEHDDSHYLVIPVVD